MSLFQSNLRKQIRNLPKILNFVKIIHYYSKLFTGVLRPQSLRHGWGLSDRAWQIASLDAAGAFLGLANSALEVVGKVCRLYKERWAANKRFEISKLQIKFPRARTYELIRARSRLYRSQILQVNIRWKALAEIYTMHRSLISMFSLKLLKFC